ncbi:hypothetical protein ACOME3_001319 [Neoechinorhynchus agilis]
MLANYPSVEFLSFHFLTALVLVFLHHLMAVRFFVTTETSNLFEMFGYLVCFVWLMPLLFVVSLSANDYVLPTTNLPQDDPLDSTGSIDIVSHYLSKRNRKLGLLHAINRIRERAKLLMGIVPIDQKHY